MRWDRDCSNLDNDAISLYSWTRWTCTDQWTVILSSGLDGLLSAILRLRCLLSIRTINRGLVLRVARSCFPVLKLIQLRNRCRVRREVASPCYIPQQFCWALQKLYIDAEEDHNLVTHWLGWIWCQQRIPSGVRLSKLSALKMTHLNRYIPNHELLKGKVGEE